MVDREVRNEFGLDELNERDVQMERAKSFMPWAFAVVAICVIAAAAIFVVPGMTNKQASQRPGAPTTTGSSIVVSP